MEDVVRTMQEQLSAHPLGELPQAFKWVKKSISIMLSDSRFASSNERK